MLTIGEFARASRLSPKALRGADEPAAAVQELISLANSAGGPDNIACVAAEIVETAGPGTPGDE